MCDDDDTLDGGGGHKRVQLWGALDQRSAKKTRTPLVYKKQRARVRVREHKQTQKVPKENVHTQAVLLCCGK